MTDQELILARVWAMLCPVERHAIAEEFRLDPQPKARLDKLAKDWTEKLRAEKAKLREAKP